MPDAQRIQQTFKQIQNVICDYLTEQDGQRYHEDAWDYAKGSGGGITRVWEHANALEKGGVNFSGIRGESLPASAATQIRVPENTPFLATGVSLVIHPFNPHVPTIHMNVRYFEAGDVWWFGGGIDLTPYYPRRDQVIEFHRGVKRVCDNAGEDYARHKTACDDYFYLKHRQEARGVGGIFFDHMNDDAEKNFALVTELGMAFPDLYDPFLALRDESYTEDEREFQLYRRSRYVEFNLIYDRGTLFGLQSNGRTESILMSLPATAKWRYNWQPEPGTREAELTEFYLKPRDWLNLKAETAGKTS